VSVLGPTELDTERNLPQGLKVLRKLNLRFTSLCIFYLLLIRKSSREMLQAQRQPAGLLDQRHFDFRFTQSFEVMLGYSPVGDRFMHGGNVHDQ
jgi:hypothetical protein